MIGKIDSSRREATVVGAGIAGLLAAYQLDRAGFEVTILEAEQRAGGLIATGRTQFGIAESAAHSFLASEEVEALCRELDVKLVHVSQKSRARYVMRGGRARRFPLSFGETVGLLGRVVFARSTGVEASMADWALKHLGPAGLDYLISPFLLGIHAAIPAQISMEAAFPSLKPEVGETLLQAVRKRERKGRAHMVAPLEGMGALVGALEQSLERRLGSRFKRGHAIDHVPDAPNVIISVPGHAAASLLRKEAPELSSTLARVTYTPMVSATIFIRDTDMSRPLRGIGILMPERENRKILGVLFNSSAFAGRVAEPGITSVTVMMGGALHPEYVDLADQAILDIIESELRELFGLTTMPVHVVINRRQKALPRYSRELAEAWEVADRTWCSRPGRVIFGNYTGEISVRGMIETSMEFSSRLCSG